MQRLWVPLTALATLTTASYCGSANAQSSQAPWLAHPVGQVSSATPASGMSLSEAITLAWQHSPSLQAAELDLQASDGAVMQAKAYPNPELQALVEDTRPESRTTTVQLAQPIELGGKRAARISAAQLSQAQSAVDLQARRAQVRADVIDAFFALAIVQERVRLAQASSDLATRAVEAVAKRVQAGKVSPVEETRAKVAQSSTRLELVQAQGDARVARQRLNGLLGNTAASPLSIDWQMAVQAAAQLTPSFVMAQTQRLSDAPMLKQARLEVDRRRALVDLEQTRRVPDVTITLGTKRAQELGRNQAVIGLALPLPVWDANQGNVLQALRLQDKAQADLASAQLQVETQWSELSERIQSVRSEVQALEQDILPGAESAWQAAVTGFEMGKFSFLDMLDAQRTLLQARTQYLRALGDLHHAAADTDRLLGSDDLTVTPNANESSPEKAEK
ncbi:TolC family protein [Aquabacterium sp.]|uniref:TolC family protein n=1 Tax=Aquabacterium sp. TaxID=1872578 RepID=UPI0035ADCE58